ncbi:MAG TPA: pyridoxal phosphate-dependent aminotransferase [Longimicrobiales bacterium]|nr:pyridoxal phosphate-dependent aminotransferase [Longimicrobiales bacterium]
MATTTQRYSENIEHIKPSATLAVAALARQLRAAGRPVIDLSAGQPDFPTPEFIAEAGVEAIRQGRTGYAPAPGIPELRAAIAEDLSESYGIQAAADGVVVTVGAKQALFNALFVLVGPGDKVLVPVPYWTSYPYLVHLARAQPVEVAGVEANGYKVGPDELEAAWDPSVRALLLNSPSNPSGAVYSDAEIRAVLEWAARREVWVLSDEIYSRIYFEGELAPGILSHPGELLERYVVINGASKSFAMTGWRIGFTYSSPELAGRMSALQSHITTSAATPAQVAAAAAYGQRERRDEAVRDMTRAFRARRDMLLELFQRRFPGAGFVQPDGAFYLFFRLDAHFAAGEGSVELCRRILEEAEVALVPGAAFGDDRYVRLSFAASEESIREGVERVATLLGAGG